jgi:hypothetical protein
MIEGSPGGAGVAKSAASAPPARRAGDVLDGLKLWLGRRLLPAHREADGFLWNLRVAHRVLWMVLAALGAYVAADLMFGSRPSTRRAASAPAATADAPAVDQDIAPLRALSDYLVAVKERNPFTGEAAQQAGKTKTTKRRLEELAEGLVVVGIDRGANPMALIEHAAQRRTFMVKVGDQINGMTIMAIAADGVTVVYEGQQLVLP